MSSTHFTDSTHPPPSHHHHASPTTTGTVHADKERGGSSPTSLTAATVAAAVAPAPALTIGQLYVAASAAGGLSWFFVHPFDLMKTQFQVAASSMVSVPEVAPQAATGSTVKTVMRRPTATEVASFVWTHQTEDAKQWRLAHRLKFPELLHTSQPTLLNRGYLAFQDSVSTGNFVRHRFYAGFSAGMTRATTYSAIMVGTNEWLKRRHATSSTQTPTSPQQQQQGEAATPPSSYLYRIAMKASDGCMAGVFASLICCPIDVALVRMQSDAQLAECHRRKYASVVHAWYRIASEEGVRVLWRGTAPLVCRAGGAGMMQVAMYDVISEGTKDWWMAGISPSSSSSSSPPSSGPSSTSSIDIEAAELLRLRKNRQHHLFSSVVTGILYGVLTMPLEAVKVRMMYQLGGASNLTHRASSASSRTTTTTSATRSMALKYPTMRAAIPTMWKEEGIKGFFRGVEAYTLRCVVSTVTYFVLYEEVKRRMAASS